MSDSSKPKSQPYEPSSLSPRISLLFLRPQYGFLHIIVSQQSYTDSPFRVQNFISDILSSDSSASVIAAGDFNEFSFVAPLETFVSRSGLQDLDVVAGIKPEERYTYLFDMNSQQLDHMYVSQKLTRKAEFEHIHVNTWVSRDEEVSDHDPSVARLDVCGGY